MMYAVDAGGLRVEAFRQGKARCPICMAPVLARCGDLRIWHWAHVAREECDPWFEPETEWHLGWKALSTPECVEVPYGPHRADILGRDDTVIELQHSDISAREVRERELFYERMVWLIDGGPFRDHFRVELRESGAIFVWSPPRPTWLSAQKPRFVHGFTVGHFVKQPNRFSRKPQVQWKPLYEADGIFQILTIRKGATVEGKGRIISAERFCQRLILPAQPAAGRH